LEEHSRARAVAHSSNWRASWTLLSALSCFSNEFPLNLPRLRAGDLEVVVLVVAAAAAAAAAASTKERAAAGTRMSITRPVTPIIARSVSRINEVKTPPITKNAVRRRSRDEVFWKKRREDVEERCFWLLTSMLQTYGVGKLMCPKTSTLQDCLERFQRTARQMLPGLMSHLERHQVLPLMYAMEWFTTLFVYSLPSKTVWEVWDLLMLQGFNLLHLVGVAILIRLQDTLLKGHPEKLLEILRKHMWGIQGREIRELCMKLARDAAEGSEDLYSHTCRSSSINEPLAARRRGNTSEKDNENSSEKDNHAANIL